MNKYYGTLIILAWALSLLWPSSCAIVENLQPRLHKTLSEEEIALAPLDPERIVRINDLHDFLCQYDSNDMDIRMVIAHPNPLVQSIFGNRFYDLEPHEQNKIIKTWMILCEITRLGKKNETFLPYVAAKVFYLQTITNHPAIRTKEKSKRSHYRQWMHQLVLKKNNTIQVGQRHHPMPALFDRWLEEISHAFQHVVLDIDIPIGAMVNILKFGLPYQKMYQTSWSLEYHAHTIIQPQLGYFLFQDYETIDAIYLETIKHIKQWQMRGLVSLRDILIYHLLVGDEQGVAYITTLLQHVWEYASLHQCADLDRIEQYLTNIGDPTKCETAIDQEVIASERRQFVEQYLRNNFIK